MNNIHPQIMQFITPEVLEQPMELSYIKSMETDDRDKSLIKPQNLQDINNSTVLPKFEYVDSIIQSLEVKQL